MSFTTRQESAVYVPGVSGIKACPDKHRRFAIHSDLRMLTTVGNAASEVLLGADAADALFGDTKLKELLDLNNYLYRSDCSGTAPHMALRVWVAPTLRGRMIHLLTMHGTYVDERQRRQDQALYP